MAGNTLEFNEIIKRKVQANFNSIGLKLCNLAIENMSVPQEVEKAFDERTKLGILGDKTDVLMKVSAAEAMKDAAKNPGNGMAGAGVGIGAGLGMGQMFAEAMRSTTSNKTEDKKEAGITCSSCGAKISASAKFCQECGQKVAKKAYCTECGAEVGANAKFCPTCGTKLK